MADAVDAAARAFEGMLRAFDPAGGPEHLLKHAQLGVAQSSAGVCGGQDRTMILDQEEYAGLRLLEVGKISLAGSDPGESEQPLP